VKHAAVALLFVALSVALTWPLSRNLGTAVAYPGDPYINAWILDWDWWATLHQPLSLFQANVFFPARYALAFSENLYGIALVLFPLRAMGVSPLAAYNVAMLFAFALSGFGAYLLGRMVSGSTAGGVAAGIFYAFVPFRFTHLSHVQHVWGGTLPLMLAALLHYARKPTWGRAALWSAAFLFNGLSNIHWLLFGAIAVAITLPILRPRLGPLAACTAAAAALLAPFLIPYARAAQLYGMRRHWDETLAYSARASDWLVVNFSYRWLHALRNPAVDPERWLFPGVVVVVLAVVGLVRSAMGRRGAGPHTERRAAAVAVVWVVVGFVGSLGLHTFFHRFLFAHVPGFQAIRVPARWAAIAYVGLAMLVALGTAVLARRRAWAGALVCLLLLFELWPMPIRWYRGTGRAPAFTRWVAEAKPRAIVELPIDDAPSEYAAMLNATAHHRPIANGHSGFAPPEYTRIATLAQEWTDDLIGELRAAGVTHLVVHADALADPRARPFLRRNVDAGRLALAGRFDGGAFGDWIFAIDGHAGNGGKPHPSAQLDAMLRGEPTYNESTFGMLNYPVWGERMKDVYVSGVAFSPYGVREVNLLFDNGAVRVPAELRADPALSRQFPWYDATPRPRFVCAFDRRPSGVRSSTDIQVEIVDGRGERTLLDDRWVEWP
jgi:hypothetical protein